MPFLELGSHEIDCVSVAILGLQLLEKELLVAAVPEYYADDLMSTFGGAQLVVNIFQTTTKTKCFEVSSSCPGSVCIVVPPTLSSCYSKAPLVLFE